MKKILLVDAEAFITEIVEKISKILPQQQNEKRWLRSSQVCEMMSISPSLLQQLRINEEIPAVKLSTGTWLYPYEGICNALDVKLVDRKRGES